MPSPLDAIQQRAEARRLRGARAGGPGSAAAPMVQTFGMYEAEYAAIRKGLGILHQPQRAIMQLTGKDVADFLLRLCTRKTCAA